MKYLLFFLVFGIALTSLSAQNIGHINSVEILENMAEAESANNELIAFQQNIQKEGEAMIKDFQAAYQVLVAEANSGEFSNIELQNKEAVLEEQRQTILAYDQQAQIVIQQKRSELFQPIFSKVDEVIQAYGKANNYAFIFDSSKGQFPFADNDVDLTAKIKAELAK
jgi:outer membrane protein